MSNPIQIFKGTNSSYKYLSTKEQRNEYRKTHDTYFKCMIHGSHLSDIIEHWGYALTDSPRKAKLWFGKEWDYQTDEHDYGFMHVYQFDKQEDGKFKCVAHWVCYWGKWITYDQFCKRNYGISSEEIRKMKGQ